MNIKRLLIPALVCGSIALNAQTVKKGDLELNMEVGTWLVSWDQKSTATDMLSNPQDGLDVNYNIDNSLAVMAKLNMNYNNMLGKLEYYNTGVTSSGNDEISGVKLGLSVLELVPYLNAEVRYNASSFEGSISAKEKSNGTIAAESPSSGKFETEVKITDLIVYPYNDYVGIGYRKYKYEFPHDMYVMRNSDNTGIARGLLNVQYDGDFYTLVVDNKRIVDTKPNYIGVIYSAIAGIGKLDPKAAGYEQWITKSDATFYDLSLGYQFKQSDFMLNAGYRYNKIETDANKKGGTHTLATEFNTEFHGPFVNLVFKF